MRILFSPAVIRARGIERVSTPQTQCDQSWYWGKPRQDAAGGFASQNMFWHRPSLPSLLEHFFSHLILGRSSPRVVEQHLLPKHAKCCISIICCYSLAQNCALDSTKSSSDALRQNIWHPGTLSDYFPLLQLFLLQIEKAKIQTKRLKGQKTKPKIEYKDKSIWCFVIRWDWASLQWVFLCLSCYSAYLIMTLILWTSLMSD